MNRTLLLTATFLLLFIGTNFVNKYVLSVLRFTYPTIFQGWQTLVGVVMFKALLSTGQMDSLMTGKEWHECALWLPGMMCFLLSIYSGSRALASLPLPVFFSMQNIIILFKAIADIILNRKIMSVFSYVMLMASILSALAVAKTDPQFHPDGYTWMCVHVIMLGAFDLYTNLIHTRLNLRHTERLFCCYLYSVVVLAPSSYFLGDALEAQRFPYWYFAKFYVGCILSGVLGMLMNLCAIRLHEACVSSSAEISIASVQAAAKIFCSCSSLAFYDIQFSDAFAMCLVVNHISSLAFSHSRSIQDKNGLGLEATDKSVLPVNVNGDHHYALKRHELQQDLIRGDNRV